jgi:homoserine dehydrogenase
VSARDVRTTSVVMTGLGNVGRRFLEIVMKKEELLARRFGLRLRVVGVADSSGAAIDPGGLDVAAVVELKERKEGVARLARVGRPGMSGVALACAAPAELLLEATPSGPRDGEPGLSIVRTALGRGLDVVLASKGPLVRGYAELAGMSDLAGPPGAPRLRFSGAVGGALPSVNIGRRDLVGGEILRVEGVLNATTQHVLGLRARGLSAAAALAEAQRIGVAEPDAELDIGGWDAASKLVILANAVLGRPTALGDVAVRGIADIDDEELRAAAVAGSRVTLLAVAERSGSPRAAPDWRLSVGPVALPAGHPLARLEIGELGIVYESELHGRVLATTRADGPGGTAAAMLRDVIEVVGRR